MDVELAKTFLIIAEEGNFRKAAERLNITQSTVSSRIQTLEAVLGKQVFLRGKKGVFFTAAGLEFKKYAENMVDNWQKIRQRIVSSPDYHNVINIGYENTIYDQAMLTNLAKIQAEQIDIRIKVEKAASQNLIIKIFEAKLDFAILRSPQNRLGIIFEEIYKDKLLLVSSSQEMQKPTENSYIYVDWGKEFSLAHNLAFPELELARLIFEDSELALKYLLTNKATGYFPETMVKNHIENKKIFVINEELNFSIPVYLAYLKDREEDYFLKALECIIK